MAVRESLRRWAPVTLLLLGAGVGVYLKRPRPHPTDPNATPSLHRDEVCDDRGWCTQTLPGGPARETTYAATWAAAQDDVWAVGLTGVAVHWDGSHWSSVPTNTSMLRGVYGFAGNDAWLVGQARALHWDGAHLVPSDVPIDGQFTDVFGTRSNDVWAVSTSGQAAHWDGETWHVVDTTFPGWLDAVWGASADDYWAAGGHSHDGAPGLVARWDGKVWTVSTLPCNCQVTALSGTGKNDVWAVGSWGTILHYDGKAWSVVPSPAKRGLMGLGVNGPQDAWAVGEESVVLHYDGKSWSGAKPDWKWLRGVTATTSDVWAVGQDGWILRWNPKDFSGSLTATAPSVEARRVPVAPTPSEANTSDTAESEALARARRLQSEGRYEAAREAFVAALGVGRAVNRRALAELAFLMASHGVGNPDEVEGALLTAANTEDPNLEAPAWYNLATYYERQTRQEEARVAMARAVLRRNRTTAAEKLDGRSSCLAEIAPNADLPRPRVVNGWVGLCAAVERCTEGLAHEEITESAARERVCALLSTNQADPRARSCDETGPWKFTYRASPHGIGSSSAWVYALPGSTKLPRFFVGEIVQASHPDACVGARHDDWEVRDGYAWFSSQRTPLWAVPGRPTPQIDDENGVCGASAKETTNGVFELNTGKPLALVAQIETYPVNLVLDAAQGRLLLTGSQCDGHVPLNGEMQWVPR